MFLFYLFFCYFPKDDFHTLLPFPTNPYVPPSAVTDSLAIWQPYLRIEQICHALATPYPPFVPFVCAMCPKRPPMGREVHEREAHILNEVAFLFVTTKHYFTVS